MLRHSIDAVRCGWGTVGIIRSASAGVGFQKDSLRATGSLKRFITVQGYRPAHRCHIRGLNQPHDRAAASLHDV